MSLPRMSCEGTVSHWLPPTILSRGSLSMSRTSATMQPFIPYGRVRNARMQRRVAASAWSGSPSLARTITDLATCAPTLTRSCISIGDPLRKTTLVPKSCFLGNCRFSSASMASLPSVDKTTTTPPPSLRFATQSSWIRRIAFSVQPSIKEWFRSITLDLPCRRLSILFRMASTTTPIRAAKNTMPPTAIRLPTTRCFGRVTSECVPGSAIIVQAAQIPSRKGCCSSSEEGSCTAIQIKPPRRI
mmetsp:Transcript_55799/g.125852  ORF Transcript_55799/g.125852 Transcript_55799/m.125852 type:complete len:244 (-) Transcript_55799:57-788(-)